MRFVTVCLLLVGCLFSGGCGAGAASPANQPPPSLELPPISAVDYSVDPDSTKKREVKAVHASPSLKILSIVLRDGTPLPAHTIPAPVYIVAVSGTGTVIADGTRLPIGPEQAVLLAPEVEHVVEPSGNEPLHLLAHQHLGSMR